MLAKKIILAAAALAALTAAGSASAQPRNFRGPQVMPRHEVMRGDFRQDFRRPFVDRRNLYATLRLHRFTGIGDPYFLRGRYVVRSHDRFGRIVLVQIDPWTGRFLGIVRV
jgi:hypothetical protein